MANNPNAQIPNEVANEILDEIGHFRTPREWDIVYQAVGVGNDDWYGGRELVPLLRPHLLLDYEDDTLRKSANILVPACGYSRLSEYLDDEGFSRIISVDFSPVLIEAMKERYRKRPMLQWIIKDMTRMGFETGRFDAIVDKGGFENLVETDSGIRGKLYLSEVYRLLNFGGKFICFSTCDSHVLGPLFSTLRFGWKIEVHAIPQLAGVVMTVARRVSPTTVYPIASFVEQVIEEVTKENSVRLQCSNGLSQWHLATDVHLQVLYPGYKMKLVLVGTRFFYTALVLDAPEVPRRQIKLVFFEKTKHSEKVFQLEDSQTEFFELDTARLILVMVDTKHSSVTKDDVMEELEHFVQVMSPDLLFNISISSANDIAMPPKTLHEVTSALTGPIIVDEVIYPQPANITFRRILFRRTESVVHSEVRLCDGGAESSIERQCDLKVLESDFHRAVIAGLTFFSIHSRRRTLTDGTVAYKKIKKAPGFIKTLIIGLGAGLLPSFMRIYFPALQIEVVEPEPMVLNIATRYFGFTENERLKVHHTNAITFIREKANSEKVGKYSEKVDVLVVDLHSSNSSTGLICPDSEFLGEHFLLTVKDSLSEKGLFVFNLISSFHGLRAAIHSNIKKVFGNLFRIPLDKDFNEAIFALKWDSPIEVDQLAESREVHKKSFEYTTDDWVEKVKGYAELIEPLN